MGLGAEALATTVSSVAAEEVVLVLDSTWKMDSDVMEFCRLMEGMLSVETDVIESCRLTPTPITDPSSTELQSEHSETLHEESDAPESEREDKDPWKLRARFSSPHEMSNSEFASTTSTMSLTLAPSNTSAPSVMSLVMLTLAVSGRKSKASSLVTSSCLSTSLLSS
jgi:hypothetical protein